MSSEAAIRPEQDYLGFLQNGRFMLLRARASGNFIFPPRVAEPGTGDSDLVWVAASGGGTVYSTSIMRERPPKADYNVALIDLDEGPRMMSRVVGMAPEEVSIGMRVRAEIVREDGEPLLVFALA